MGKFLKADIYVPFLLFILGTVYFSVFGKHVILYQNDEHLFLYTSSYLHSFLNMPGGFSEWLSAFFTQFYFYPALGAVVVSAILVFAWLLSRYMFSYHGLKFDPGFSIVVYGVLFGIVQYFENSLVPVVSVIINMSFLFLALRINKAMTRLLFEVVASLLLYMVTGAYFAIFIAVTVVSELLLFKGKMRFFSALVVFSLGIYIPYFLSIHYYFLFAPVAYKYPVVTDAHFYGYSFAVIVAMLLILVLFTKVVNRKEKLAAVFKKYSRITIPVFFMGVILYLGNIYNPSVAKLVYFSQLGKNAGLENLCSSTAVPLWDEVLDFSKRQDGSASLYPYYTNLALSYKGRLLDDMMRYDQRRGIAGLCYPWVKNSHMREHGGLFYFTLGYVNEAHHWAYESMVHTGPVAPVLKELTIYNLVLGKTEGAKKYLNVLEQTLFYRSWAGKFMELANDTNKLNSLSWVKAKRKQIPHGDYFVNLSGIKQNIEKMVEENPDNKTAFDYLIAYYLLDARPDMVAKKLTGIKHFYKTLPETVKEALVLLQEYPDELRDLHSRLGRYIAARDRSLLSKKEKELFVKKYSATYWYYIDFVSPHHKFKR